MNHRVTTQEKILDAAMEIALREGLDKLSIRKIASSCGIAIGSVYNYCKNKDALNTAVAERFWERIFEDQERLYHPGMGFSSFLEQYYLFLYGRLSSYDSSWLRELEAFVPERSAVPMMRSVLEEDVRVNHSIWNMQFNEDSFCEYVFTNIMALLRAGENNCRFFIFLLEHLLYSQ